MTDYTKLVKELRGCKYIDYCKDCPRMAANGYVEICNIKDDAAAAIEDLQAEVERLEPKRGKWIIDGAYTYNLRELNGKAYEPVYRCSCCNRQTESYLRLDEPKMPEDADFPEYCPHCGAKMEVQDAATLSTC